MIETLGALVDIIRANESAIRVLGIGHLDVIGSWARGAANADSDVDLVAEFSEGHRGSYFDLARLKMLLEDRLHVQVDVLSRRGIDDNGKNVGESVRVF